MDKNKLISEKISFLKKEGYPQDQAVAISISMYKSGRLRPGGVYVKSRKRTKPKKSRKAKKSRKPKKKSRKPRRKSRGRTGARKSRAKKGKSRKPKKKSRKRTRFKMTEKMPTPLKAVKGKTDTETRSVEINGKTYNISVLCLYPGTRLYTASLGGLNMGHNAWFGIKPEDVTPYGPKIETYAIAKNNKVCILDLSGEEEQNKAFARSLLPSKLKAIFDTNWGEKRRTTREGDFPVARALREKLLPLGILGFGTGRGESYIDAPQGHHSEICIFPPGLENLEFLGSSKTTNPEAQLAALGRKQNKARKAAKMRDRGQSNFGSTARSLF